MERCDICRITFKAAEPNEAVADAKLRASGVEGRWAFLCKGHLDYAMPGWVVMLHQD